MNMRQQLLRHAARGILHRHCHSWESLSGHQESVLKRDAAETPSARDKQRQDHKHISIYHAFAFQTLPVVIKTAYIWSPLCRD